MTKNIYSKLATVLSTIAVLTVSVASIAFIYSPEPPAELFE
ncbi:cyclic lactone autoinducer peptide [Paenibacillus kribbensis]|nr:cyclic lactone autoinducer peptide [Paenibacillus kribbensis]MEC0233764.1 cyclic lactone autoinducer peptide [Paenibacillus kribbensis]